MWPHDFPDPFVIRHGGRFYAYATQKTGVDFAQIRAPQRLHREAEAEELVSEEFEEDDE